MLDVLQKLFDTRDLYQVLGISSKDANDPKKLRNAYHRAALSFHPDKAPDDKNATQKFQLLKCIYELLKDEGLKQAYDETGEWPGEKVGIDLAWPDEDQFMEKFEQFKKEYNNSETEREDIKKCYEEYKGSFMEIFDRVYFINVVDDLDRVSKIIEDAIEAGEIERAPEPKGYAMKWKRYLTRYRKEAKEAEAMLAERCRQQGYRRRQEDPSKVDNSHQAPMLLGQEQRDGFHDQLAANFDDDSEELLSKKPRRSSRKYR